jgi:hypothetical protein
MKVCSECDEKFNDHILFCGMCGKPLPEPLQVAPAVDGDSSPGIVMKVLAAPALLFGAFLAVVLLITYYAGFVAAMLSFGLPLAWGIVAATVMLFGVIAVFFLHRSSRSRT